MLFFTMLIVAGFFDTLNQTIILDAQRRAGDGLSWDVKWNIFPRGVFEWESGLWPSFDARHTYQGLGLVLPAAAGLFYSGIASILWFPVMLWIGFYVPRNLFLHNLLLRKECPYRRPWYKSIIRSL